MFLKSQILLKLMKRGYKKWGLNVGRHDNTLCLNCERWEVETDFSTVPKSIKAQIVEFCGELPESGEYATLSPGGSQELMPMPIIGEPLLEGKMKVYRTNLRLADAFVLQPEDHDKMPAILIKEEYIELAEDGEPDYERGEIDVSGPYMDINDMSIYYWTNTTVVRFLPMESQNQKGLMGALNQINLMEIDS